MRVSKLARPGPIIIAVWFICYLVWAFYLPYEWVRAIRKFLFDEHLDLKTMKSLGVRAVGNFLSLPVEFLILGIFLLLALVVGFAWGRNWLQWRAVRNLFQ